MGNIRNLGGLVFERSNLCLMARIWRAGVCRNVDDLRVSPVGDPAAGCPRCRGGNRRQVWSGWRDVPWRVRVPVLCRLPDGNIHIPYAQSRGHGRIDLCAAWAGRVGGGSSPRRVAGFCIHPGYLGVREVWPIALVVAVPWREIGVRDDRSRRGECGVSVVLAGPAREGHRVFHRLGKSLGPLCSGEFPGVRVHCHSLGYDSALHCLCATMEYVEHLRGTPANNPHVHGVAGRTVVSRPVAKLSGPGLEERCGGMVDRVGAFRVFARHEYGVSQLAVRDSGDGRGFILWLDVEEKRVHLRFDSCDREVEILERGQALERLDVLDSCD